MSKAIKSTFIRVLIPVFLSVFLSGCGKTTSPLTSIGFLSGVTTDNTTVNLSGIALEQKNGYELGMKAASTGFTPKNIDENTSQSDIQKTILSLAEDPNAPISALLGASSNLATSHAAALVNFFNVPMLVPSSNGDNLFPSNNLWAFRLSPPGSAYAGYLFGNLLTKANAGSDAQLQSEYPGLRIAILYEENTFGESAAVAAAEAAMAQSIQIGTYANFPTQNLDPDTVKTLMDQVKAQKVQLVYLISSDPKVAKTLVQAFLANFSSTSIPVLVGQAGGFASLEFLSSAEAQNVFVLRQQLVENNCPADVKSIYEAQSYASVYLLDQAVKQAVAQKNVPTSWFSAPASLSAQSIAFREKVRDYLKDSNSNLPCLGQVAFDNTGQNKLLQLEMITIHQGQTLANQVDNFSKALKLRLQQIDSFP